MTEHRHDEDAACAVAHAPVSGSGTTGMAVPAGAGAAAGAGVPAGAGAVAGRGAGERVLVAVFASPVAGYLLRYGTDLGYRAMLLEPDEVRAATAAALGFPVVTRVPEDLDDSADLVLTDHHRDELGVVLRDALATKVRWIGLMGNPRHEGPHVVALTALGVTADDIARVHRPIGLNIGSRTPPEIAISTLAGLLADRNDRPGGFEF
ncbi:MAG TPA: XdhC family protein [Streptosporangiaceae bacterium]|jgi:xanthine dehydrogenase accessory factor|nr:XdhC family protein [Streptosporangiaceae bacterium]